VELTVSEPEPDDGIAEAGRRQTLETEELLVEASGLLQVTSGETDVVDPRRPHARSLSELGAPCNGLGAALPGKPGAEHHLVSRSDELEVADRKGGPAEHVEGAQERG
jgi:hypothetical protein